MDDSDVDTSKKIRVMEGTRKAYAGDAKNTIKKQSETIQVLQKENEKLKNDIQNASKHSSVKHNIEHQNRVSHLSDSSESLDRKVQMEEDRLNQLDQELADTKTRMLEARKLMGGVNVAKDNSQMVEKQIRVLENRLDQSLVSFNEALAYNKELREQIDNLRRERVVFDGIYKRLERELHEKKKAMADIIEKSNLYYEERDLATSELTNLKLSAEKEMLQYEEHFRQLEVMLEADKNLKESLKQSQRFKPGVSMKHASPDASPIALSSVDDSSMSPKSRKAKEEKEEKDEVGFKENYDEVVEHLRRATGISDLAVLYDKFMKAEEQNFSMYNFVNDLNNEIEKLVEECGELQTEHERHGGVDTDAQRNREVKILEEKLHKAEQGKIDNEMKSLKMNDLLSEMRVCIESIFNKLGCGGGDVAHQVTDGNVMQFLGSVESRANDMLQVRSILNAQKRATATQLEDEEAAEDEGRKSIDALRPARIQFIGHGPSVPFGSTNIASLVGTLPSTGDTFGQEGYDDAEDDRVLTQEELRAQTEARMAAKEDAKREAKRGKQKKKKDISGLV